MGSVCHFTPFAFLCKVHSCGQSSIYLFLTCPTELEGEESPSPEPSMVQPSALVAVVPQDPPLPVVSIADRAGMPCGFAKYPIPGCAVVGRGA